MKLFLTCFLVPLTWGASAKAQANGNDFTHLEGGNHARIGVAAVDVTTNRRFDYRADERFLMCSTFKVLAVAAVLQRVDQNKEKLERFVKYGEGQLLTYAPVTRAHVHEGGMTLEALCAAAIEQSDNTAGNLILEAIGGPKGFNEFMRSLGDESTHLDRIEPELNAPIPGKDSDSTSPAAMCRDLQHLLSSDFLSKDSRVRLEGWMQATETGLAMIRAGIPKDWNAGDKTGRSGTGATNDVAILRSPSSGPIFMAIYTDNPNDTMEARDKLVAEIAKVALGHVASGVANGFTTGPCATAVEEGLPCAAAARRGRELMKAANLTATTEIVDVHTGSLLVDVTSDPARLDSDSALLPLSTVKLLVAASWLDHEQSAGLPDSEELLSDMLVQGNDNAGKRVASALRKGIGTEAVLNDLKHYQFTPSLSEQTTTEDWEDTLSIGERRVTITTARLSFFLQAIGNGGIGVSVQNDERIMQESTALKLQSLMREAVERGTAKSAANVLAGTGWQIGGKTGTGPGVDGAPGPESDGWFAGLVFDPQGKARFTVATFVKHGGLGGGNAARISAELASFLIGADSSR